MEVMTLTDAAIARERAAIGGELQQARTLLRDGMAKLYGFFDSLCSDRAEHAALLESLRDGQTPADVKANALSRLAELQKQMQTQSEKALLGLQLEDVLGQLIEHTQRRVAGLCDLTDKLADALNAIGFADDSAAAERLRAELARIERAANECMVRQESLGSGDIELF